MSSIDSFENFKNYFYWISSKKKSVMYIIKMFLKIKFLNKRTYFFLEH